MSCECEPVANPLGLEQKCIQEVVVCLGARLQCLSAMEQKGYLDTCRLTVLLKLKKFGNEKV